MVPGGIMVKIIRSGLKSDFSPSSLSSMAQSSSLSSTMVGVGVGVEVGIDVGVGASRRFQTLPGYRGSLHVQV